MTLRFFLREFNAWQKMNGKEQVEVGKLPESQQVKVCDLCIRGMSFDTAYTLVTGLPPKKVVDTPKGKCYHML